jgi:hypothetical protein
MPYTLENFCADCRTQLKSGKPLDVQLSAMAESLSRLLATPEFVASTFKPEDDFTKKELHHDPDLDYYVLAHVHQGPKEGPPHSHGASWAIYGTAMGVTGMKEWERSNPESEEAAVLRMAEHYELKQGQTRGYGPHRIHSTIHPAKAWVIRVTGTNLDALPRYRFNKKRDRIEAAA